MVCYDKLGVGGGRLQGEKRTLRYDKLGVGGGKP